MSRCCGPCSGHHEAALAFLCYALMLSRDAIVMDCSPLETIRLIVSFFCCVFCHGAALEVSCPRHCLASCPNCNSAEVYSHFFCLVFASGVLLLLLLLLLLL